MNVWFHRKILVKLCDILLIVVIHDLSSWHWKSKGFLIRKMILGKRVGHLNSEIFSAQPKSNLPMKNEFETKLQKRFVVYKISDSLSTPQWVKLDSLSWRDIWNESLGSQVWHLLGR